MKIPEIIKKAETLGSVVELINVDPDQIRSLKAELDGRDSDYFLKKDPNSDSYHLKIIKPLDSK